MSKEIFYGADAREKLRKGAKGLYEAVKVTLGPKGRNVVIERNHGVPHVTKDGVTVAEDVFFEDQVENMGAQMIKDTSKKTADIAGDGTTTSVVLSYAIIDGGMNEVELGANPIDLKRGIDKAVELVVAELKKGSLDIGHDYEKVMHIASISANNDYEIGSLIASAMEKVGVNGVVTVEESKSILTEVTTVNGMQFDNGYLSPYFVNNTTTNECELTDPYILIYDKKINSMKEIVPLLEQIIKIDAPLLIIAEEVGGEAMPTLVLNNVKGKIKVAAITSPFYSDLRVQTMHDLAIATGGKYISETMGMKLEKVTLADLGQASVVRVSKDSTTIFNGKGDKTVIAERIQSIKDQQAVADTEYAKQVLQNRLAKMTGSVAILKIGAASEVEMKEKKDRVDDALHATRAAISEGVVEGGGVALLKAGGVLEGLKGINDDVTKGIQIVLRATEEPLRQIVNNTGADGEKVLCEVIKTGVGYNARTEVHEDLIAAGVIDPTKVVRVALENAASVAGTFLLTNCSINEKHKK